MTDNARIVREARVDACPLCGVIHMEPRPIWRSTDWSDTCACSDRGPCVAHQIDPSDAPKRPTQEMMQMRAESRAAKNYKKWEALMESFTRYRALETELATAKADLERAREANNRPRGLEFLDGAIAILDRNPYPPGYAGILGPLRSYLMDLRAALAPEQKG